MAKRTATPSKWTRAQILMATSSNMRANDRVDGEYWHAILVSLWGENKGRVSVAKYVKEWESANV